jgi:hypothetical protein
MKWAKHGIIVAPDKGRSWASARTYLPTATLLADGRLRIFFSGVDGGNVGRAGYCDVDGSDPRRVLEVSPEPILDIGELGTFDDCGVNPSSVVDHRGCTYLFYLGWQRGVTVPYYVFTGLALRDSDSAGAFEPYARVPVLDRTNAEPFSRSAPCVLIENGVFRAWYVSYGSWWTDGAEKRHYSTEIRLADSVDGIHWSDEGVVCLRPDSEGGYGVTRPWVLKDSDRYRMWYSIRSKTSPYRLGYAESDDGVAWEAKDSEVGLERSDEGWDSEQVCCPCVVDAAGGRYMFYNGNGFGTDGFGYAELVEP